MLRGSPTERRQLRQQIPDPADDPPGSDEPEDPEQRADAQEEEVVGGEGNGQRFGRRGRTGQQGAPIRGADGEPDQELEERGGGGKGARMAGGGGGERGE